MKNYQEFLKETIQNNERTILSEDPLVYVVENFATDKECDEIVFLATGKLEKAKVVDETGNSIIHSARTGSNVFIGHSETLYVKNLSERIARLVGISLKNAEKMQVVHYGITETYDYHNDGFRDGSKALENGGQRIMTALLYLNNVEEGGSTSFKNLKIDVQPQKGKLLVFETVKRGSNKIHEGALHAGMPVTKGEKYACNFWFREKERID